MNTRTSHTTVNDRTGVTTDRLQNALLLLVEADQYSIDAGCGIWDFAIEIGLLKSAGVNINDLRWLISKGFVEAAREVTVSGDTKREFRFNVGLKFTKRTCFVLTKIGLDFAVSCDSTEGQSKNASMVTRRKRPFNKQTGPMLPQWNMERRELRIDGKLVKQFKVPAANQEVILNSFQEENWPHRIDDPLPPNGAIDPKRRLHAAINSLNRNQKSRLIRFHGDGRGQGVCWEQAETTK